MIHGTLGETSKQTDYTLDSFKGPVKVLRRDQFYLGAEACQGKKKKKTAFWRRRHFWECPNPGSVMWQDARTMETAIR